MLQMLIRTPQCIEIKPPKKCRDKKINNYKFCIINELIMLLVISTYY